MTLYSHHVQEIIDNLDKFHQKYYAQITFHGPSLHFHQRALETGQRADFDHHLELIYAALVSWGMHRMGRGGSKMKDFTTFRSSVLPFAKEIASLRPKHLCELSSTDWNILERLFKSIHVMATGTSLIGHSKVMAHLLPQSVIPIDRNYTLRYLRGNTNVKNDLTWEWQLFKSIHHDFVSPIVVDTTFRERAKDWLGRQEEFPWDTSLPKIVDNLLIGGMGKLPSSDGEIL